MFAAENYRAFRASNSAGRCDAPYEQLSPGCGAVRAVANSEKVPGARFIASHACRYRLDDLLLE
jgi:hypothetical protein